MRIKDLIFGGAGAADKWGNAGLLILRLTAGAQMASLHGIKKMPPADQMIAGVEKIGFPAPTVFAWAAALSELVGGVLIAIGLFTRPAAFFLGCTMAVAGFIVHGSDPWAKKELAFIYLSICLLLLLTGAGRFSIDALLRRK